MEEAIQLSVPLEVTLKSGRNWYEVAAMDAGEIERV
jgi:DNA polymerase I-like protein with 3'-5' exonuclease and polymerase domains